MVKILSLSLTFSMLCFFAAVAQSKEIRLDAAKDFSCPPCAHHSGYVDDLHHKDGVCPVCDMNLIAKPKFSQLDQPHITPGAGNFVMSGNAANPDSTIVVFYHSPKKVNKDTRVLFVVPGTGRNAWDYRDAWIKASKKYNILVLSPSYAEQDYDFAAYHMGGVIRNLKFLDTKAAQRGRETSRYNLKDEDVRFDLNKDKSSWLFNDFDRIFDAVISTNKFDQSSYDMFGHSAGGQILHRMVLFNPDSKADTIIAANSGLYTLPNWRLPPLFGLKDMQIEQDSVRSSLSKKLVVLVGEHDNQDEHGGTLLHTPLADQQGLGRLSRAESFYAAAVQTAESLGVDHKWKLQIAKGVGHNYRKMSKHAAKLLYGD